MPVQPRRLTGQALRAAARTLRSPLVGNPARKASLAVYGIAALREARLGDTLPFVAGAADGPPAPGAQPVQLPAPPRAEGRR